MNYAFICVLIMLFLPYIWVGLAKFGGKGGFNNNAPRAALAKLDGWRQRANWAQSNQFEAIPFFIAGVMVATYNHAPQTTLNILAISVLALRIVYGVLYIQNLASLRSLVWFVSVILMSAMFFI